MPLIGTRGAASAQGFGEFAQQASVVQAEAIDFDGTNDFLRRTSDLTGNTDGKTFTFSFWTWIPVGAPLGFVYYANNAGAGRFLVEVGAGQTVRIRGWRTTGTITLDVTTSSVVPAGTFANILVSVDLANAANRSIYINDVLTSATWTTYGNNDIEFTCSQHDVCSNGSAADGAKRLSNIFLDYTYRDMSITANRRLFVTADLKPAAGQAALNPIMYLPMSDPTAPGLNQGTGGNFTLTGVVARSGRGPNQYNVAYSTFDGSADYLTSTSFSVPATKTFTVSVVINSSLGANVAGTVFYTRDSATSTGIELRYFTYAGGDTGFFLEMQNSAGTNIFTGYVPKITTIASGRNYVLTLCINMDSQSACRAYLNGTSTALTVSNFSAGQTIRATNRASVAVTADFIGNFYNPFAGRIGAFWFSTTYVDLSVADNLAKFVTGTGINAAPVDLGATGQLPTGTSPLLYLPLYGNAAGLNYGTGGNFTVNSGPYTGARGPNEFWGNRAVSNGTTGFLSRSALSGVTDGTTFTFCCWFFYDGNAGKWLFNQNVNTTTLRGLNISVENSNRVVVQARNSSGTVLVNSDNTAASMVTSGFNSLMISIDVTNSAKRFVYVNGVAATLSFSTYTNGSINLSSSSNLILRDVFSSAYNNQPISELYLSTQYIDFSQEANRLLFRDAFGNPTNLPSAITAGTVPNPAIYMRFPPTSFGTNSGTGGDFTVNGTITDGGQL